MTVDPREVIADWEGMCSPQGKLDAGQDAIDIVRSIVPLHDAWLKANPPCPTCDGAKKIACPACHGKTNPDESIICATCNDFTRIKCQACDHPYHPGVLPFDKWTAGLVALWTLAEVVEHLLTDELPQIGGAR